MTDRSVPIEIYNDSEIHAVAFSPDGKYLMCGDDEGFGVWRAEDGREMTRMATGLVHCLAVSRDGRWMAVGTSSGVILWNAETYERVKTLGDDYVIAVDFSPDPARLATASFNTCTATVWDIARRRRRRARTLRHEGRRVIATKYSPRGDRIATATHEFVRIWDANDGRLLVDIPVPVTPEYNNGLLWSNDYLFVVSYDEIKQFDASTGSALSECRVPTSIGYSCIALLQHGEFIAYSTSRTIVLWHTSSLIQLTLVHHPQNLFFIALSPDGRSLAIGGRDGKITIKRLSRINERDIRIDDAALDCCELGQLANAEALLIESCSSTHHVLASRAPVRACSQQWDAVLVDAEMAINARPSNDLDVANRQRLCETLYAVGRTNDAVESLLKMVNTLDEEVYMSGRIAKWVSDFAKQCLSTPEIDADAASRITPHNNVPIHPTTLNSPTPTPILRLWAKTTLASGSWRDALAAATGFVVPRFTVYRAIYERLETMDRTTDLSKCLLKMADELVEQANAHREQVEWVLGKLESLGDTAMSAKRPGDAVSHYSAALALDPATPQDLFLKRSKAYVEGGLLQAALNDANKVIELDPSSPWGYEMKHAALQKAVEHENVISVFEAHSQSSGLAARTHHHRKGSPEITSEMEETAGISARVPTTLRAGSDDIRRKPRLDERREATLVENSAYSLLEIFSVCLPVVYDEGDETLGRLLAQLLTRSGDTSFLAWTGKSGTFNSCLPGNIDVFDELRPPHIPHSITSAEMQTITAGLRTTLPNLISVAKLYNRLDELHAPLFSGKRMRLPCIVFKLGPLSVSRGGSTRVFRAKTRALGIVEIRSEEDLSRFNSLYLVHPWIDFLLDRHPTGRAFEENTDAKASPIGELSSFPGPSSIASAVPQSRTVRPASHFGQSSDARTATRPRDAGSIWPPSPMSQRDKQLQVIARLKQPFGALLLKPIGSVLAYRRVAAESLITVQIEEITQATLDKLVDSVCMLDVV